MKLFSILITLLLFGCSESFYSELPATISVFRDELNSSFFRKLTSEDIEYKELDNWLRRNKDDWKPVSTEYSGGIFVHSKNSGYKYAYQLINNKIVVYSTHFPEAKAFFVKKLKPNEIRGLRDIDK